MVCWVTHVHGTRYASPLVDEAANSYHLTEDLPISERKIHYNFIILQHENLSFIRSS